MYVYTKISQALSSRSTYAKIYKMLYQSLQVPFVTHFDYKKK